MNTVKTILFVENDPVALEMYRNRLLREGFHVESAQDGLEALKVLSQLTPDLVVLDMMLPKLSGADVLKFIRTDNRSKTLPVVIFSNAPMTEPTQEIALAGPTKRLLKSDCTFPMLLQTIQELLITAATTAPANVFPVDRPLAANGLPDVSVFVRNDVSKGSTEFLSEALTEIPKIREHCFAYIKSPASPAGLQHLPNLYQRVHFLSTNAGKAGCARVALLANAFDTLLSEIMVKPSWVTPSVLQTIAQAVDCLGFLLKSNAADLAQPMPQARVLAVDDDAVCNHVIVNTLKRANFDAKSVDDPLVALQILQSTQFDLVLLDINMPDLTGFEVCEKLRRFPHCKTTPVIFITGHNNFDNRKQSVLSGGHDFITKPVSPSELALKATIHLLKVRVQRGVSQPGTDPGAGNMANDTSPAENPIRRMSSSVNPGQTSLPASALLPDTESGTGAPGERYPGASGPVAQPPSTPVPDTIFEPVNSIQILQPGANRVDSSAPSIQFPPTTGSRNVEPEQISAPDTDLPPEETSSIRISGGIFQSGNSISLNQPETSPVQNVALSSLVFPPAESGAGDLEMESFSSGTTSAHPPAAPQIPEEVLQHFAASEPESHLHEQLEAARAAVGQTEAALREKETAWSQMETELTGLRQVRDEFQGKLAAELEAATRAQQEVKELQEQLNRSAAELEAAKAGVNQRSDEQARLESDLRGQVEAAKAAAQQAETELTGLRQVKDESQAKLVTEQEAAARAQLEVKELQEQLNRSVADLEAAKAGVKQRSDEQARLESDLRGQVEAAKAAAAQSEAAFREKETGWSRTEAELTGLRQAKDEFQAKLVTEQEAAARAQQEVKELQEQLNRSAADLEAAKAGVKQRSDEQARLESDLRGQVEAAKAATAQSEASRREKESGWSRMETELTGLRQAKDEFQAKLVTEQEAAVRVQQEVKELQERLNRNTAELEEAKAGMEQQSEARTRLESELRGQVEAVKAAAVQSEATLREKESGWSRMETELTGLRQAKDEFQAKLVTEQEAATRVQQEVKELQERLNRNTAELEQAKTVLKQQLEEQTRLESDLREQLETAKTSAVQTATFLKEKDAWCNELEEELTRLQQERDEFQGKLAAEQEAAAKAQQQVKELQERLNRSASELEQARVGVDQHSEQQARLESDLRGQVEATKAAAQQAETELTGLRQARDEFQGKLADEQEAAAKAQQQVKELQERLNQNTAELEVAKAGVEQQSEARTRLESDSRGQLEAARAATAQSEAALREKETGWSRMETELTGLRQAKDEFQGKLTTEQEATAQAQQEVKELQERLNRSAAELETAKAGAGQQLEAQKRMESQNQNLAEEKEAVGLELSRLREGQTIREAEMRDKQKKIAEALQESVHLLQDSLEPENKSL